jgi:uncharacterized protein (DUF488 family)
MDNLPGLEIYSIGHGNSLLSQFSDLLIKQGIQTLVDVRSTPYSKHNPHFDREYLSLYLQKKDIHYVYMGKKLGGRPVDPTVYFAGEIPQDSHDFLHLVNYPEIMTRAWFQQGIEEMVEVASASKTVFMCSEEDPSTCHRHFLIAQYLLKQRINVRHLRADGRIEEARSLARSPELKVKKTIDAGLQPSLF